MDATTASRHLGYDFRRGETGAQMTGTLRTLGVLAFFAISGLPIAWCTESGRRDKIRLIFEACVIGLVVQQSIALVALHLGHYSVLTVVVGTVLVGGGSVLALRRLRSRATASPVAGPAPETASSPTWTILGLLAVVGVALALRTGPSYFIFQTGDMGGYVNSANILRYATRFSALSMHGLIVLMRTTNLLFGRGHTVAGLPALGILFLLGVAAFGRAIGLHAIAVLGIAALVAVHPVTTWFSLFPVSETLSAVLLIGALYLRVRARAEVSHTEAVLAGIVLAAALLARGEVMLFAPIIVVTLLASAALDEPRPFEVERTFAFTTLVGFVFAYAYDVHFVDRYFIGQLHRLAPGFVVTNARRLRLLDATPQLLVGAVIVLGGVYGAVVLTTRFVRLRAARARPETAWRAAYVAVIALTAVTMASMSLGGLADALTRWGVVLLVLCVAGIVAITVKPGRYLDGATGLMLLLVIGVFLVLFAHRDTMARNPPYYLYFDRYLYSEALPAALVVSAIGLHAVVVRWRTLAPNTGWFRVGIAALLVVASVGLAPEVRETRVVTRYPLFGDSYGALSRLDALTRGTGNEPIVYSGLPFKLRGWFFQNTFRAFELPLVQSFRRTVVGMPSASLGHDPRYGPFGARMLLAKAGFRTGYLISLRLPRTARPPAGPHARYVATVDYQCPTLGQNLHNNPPPRWHLFALRFDVYALS